MEVASRENKKSTQRSAKTQYGWCSHFQWKLVVKATLEYTPSGSWCLLGSEAPSWGRLSKTRWRRENKGAFDSGSEERTRWRDCKDPRVGCRGQYRVVAVPPPQDVPGLKEQNISERWLPADDPAAGTTAPLEMHQEDMPSRRTQLCSHTVWLRSIFILLQYVIIQ